MKKLLIIVGAVVLALSFGTAFAADKEMSPGLYNGVTAFEPERLAARVAGPEMALENGITIFDTGISVARADEYGASGSAAGGMRAEDSHIDPWNGVTVFNPVLGDTN